MKYFARVSHDPWRSGLNAWLRSSVCVLYSVASMLQDFIASNTCITVMNRAKGGRQPLFRQMVNRVWIAANEGFSR